MSLKHLMRKGLSYAFLTYRTQVDKISNLFFQRRFWIGFIVLITIYLLLNRVFNYIGDVLYDAPIHSNLPKTKNEQSILSQIKINKEKSIYFIDLKDILKKPITKICFKEPMYSANDVSYVDFEKSSSIPVKAYIKTNGIEKSRGYYWILYKDGMVENLNITHAFFEYGNEVNFIKCTKNSKVSFEQ